MEKQGIGHRFKQGMTSFAVVGAAMRTFKVIIAKEMTDTGNESWAKAVAPAAQA